MMCKTRWLTLAAFALSLSLAAVPSWAASKSAKRGVAYHIASPADLGALAPGVSWWYNWSPRPHDRLVSYDYPAMYGVDFIPMVWNDNVDDEPAQAVPARSSRDQIPAGNQRAQPGGSGQSDA